MRTIGSVGAYFGLWLLALVAATIALYGVAYLASPFGPGCAMGRSDVPSTQIPIAVINIGAPALATLFVGLYAALGVRSVLRRLAAILVVVIATAVAGTVGALLTSACT